MRLALCAATLVITAACSNPTGSIAGPVAVRATPPVLQLTNNTTAPVYAFVIERRAAAYTDWAPCTDAAACPGIVSGATVAVPYGKIVGYTPAAREAIVYWWHLMPDGGSGFRPDSLRAVVVGL